MFFNQALLPSIYFIATLHLQGVQATYHGTLVISAAASDMKDSSGQTYQKEVGRVEYSLDSTSMNLTSITENFYCAPLPNFQYSNQTSLRASKKQEVGIEKFLASSSNTPVILESIVTQIDCGSSVEALRKALAPSSKAFAFYGPLAFRFERQGDHYLKPVELVPDYSRCHYDVITKSKRIGGASPCDWTASVLPGEEIEN